ncbi:MAG: Rho termination factor N-terminal domain-containing protein [Nitrospirota bacterium]|nr:Rho termination factor N-terminal domain-containing protein [Nitrospirota bacterium]
MTVTELKTIAANLGIKAGKLKKTELIHEIQKTEGNFPCFGTATSGVCDQYDCLFRSDCLGNS